MNGVRLPDGRANPLADSSAGRTGELRLGRDASPYLRARRRVTVLPFGSTCGGCTLMNADAETGNVEIRKAGTERRFPTVRA